MSGHPLQEQLKKAHEELRTWREARDRAVAQLGLIHNLVNQLETLHKCRAGHHLLGVVAQHPLCVQLLEVKLIQAVERAYTRAMKEKGVLLDVVQKLRKYVKEGQKTFTVLVEQNGLEEECRRRAECFSGADYLAWLTDTHSSYRADLEDKLSTMDALEYTSQSLGHVCAVWERDPVLNSDYESLSKFDFTNEIYNVKTPTH